MTLAEERPVSKFERTRKFYHNALTTPDGKL